MQRSGKERHAYSNYNKQPRPKKLCKLLTSEIDLSFDIFAGLLEKLIGHVVVVAGGIELYYSEG